MLYEISELQYKEEIAGKKDSTYVLVFHATWCPPCRNFKSSLEELAEKDGIDVYRIDVDQNQSLAGEFGVRNLPTWFIMKDNQVAEKVVGYQPYDELVQTVKKHL